MISKNKSILAAAVLSVLSTGVNAKIYPDQIVRENLGDDVCSTGYRPLEYPEAFEHRKSLVQRMDTWDIVGLKDDWVVMGPGYYGNITQAPTYGWKTFCYPYNDQAEIPYYPTKSVPEEADTIGVEYELVHDHQDFVIPLSYLAHHLGYAWVGGNYGPSVGEDMDIKRSGNGWVIQGNNSGSCDGYRCGEKTKFIVNNFTYTLDGDNFEHGEVQESDRELIKTVFATATNNTDVSQTVVVDLKVNESTHWSKTNSYGFSESVSAENTFKWPLVGDTKVNVTFEANQSFASTNGGDTSESVTLQARVTVPAQSKIQIKVELYNSSISYPYQFNADIAYDVEFDGFLRYSGNAWHTHPTNRPNQKHKFTMGRASDHANDIRYQWDHRYIEGLSDSWDWSWAIQEAGLKNMQLATGGSLRPFHSFVSGEFFAESQYAGSIIIGQPNADGRSIEGENQTTVQLGNIEVTTNFDAQELSDLGFEGAEFNVRLAD